MIDRVSFKAEPQRVGLLLRRDKPPRLVQRFGYVMPDRTARLDPDRYGSVLWDDGQLDLVEWERLLSMWDMNDNPDRVPIVSFEDEIGRYATGQVYGAAGGSGQP